MNLVVAQNGSDIQIGHQLGTVSASYARQTSGDLIFSTTGQGYWDDAATVGTLRAREQESHEHLVLAFPGMAQAGQGWAPPSMPIDENIVGSLDTTRQQCVLAFTERTRADGHNIEYQDDLAYRLTNPGSGGRPHSKLIQDTTRMLRRLTPRECERLQGFTDDYTLVPYRGKPAKDGPRYRAIGNSFAVPVVRWIGERIAQVSAAVAPSQDESEKEPAP